MRVDSPTLILYTTVMMALIGALFAFFWSREDRPVGLPWLVLPFLLGAAGAACTIAPTGYWMLWLAAFFLLLAYGFAWQGIRIFYRRKPLPLVVVALTSGWLLLSIAGADRPEWVLVSAIARTGLIAAFCGLAARELWLSRSEDLPSRRILFRVFAICCGLHLARIPLMQVAPMPIGLAPTTSWAVIVYNLSSVVLALLATVFLIALARERVSAHNYGMAMRDAMTGVYNRRAYYEQMHAPGEEGNALPYALFVFDIDRFKTINDRFGHDTGDLVIVTIARAARASLRAEDRIFRMGGDEFVCLLPGANLRSAYEAAERIRSMFEKVAATVDGKPVNATISIGVAATDGELGRDEVFSLADAALYAAKKSGRNQTFLAPSHEEAEPRPERLRLVESGRG